MKKIIVTGGLGFIGSNLIELLIKKNYFIINIDKISYSSNFYNVKEFKSSKQYKFIKCDINNKKIKNILNKYKPIAIFNLAAETHVDRSIDNPEDFIHSNILGVYNLLECFKKYSKKYTSKLIHISTDEVYGDIISSRSNEKFPYNPSSPYSASKASADHLIKSYIRTYNLPAMISNCCNNYGPYQFPEKLIPVAILKALNNESIPLYGDGKNIRDWLYVEDHVDAIMLVARKGVIGKSYCIGGFGETTNQKILKMICSCLDKFKPSRKPHSELIKLVKDRPGHDKRYSIDPKRIIQDLGWEPKVNLEKGLEITVKWYLENIE